MNRHESREKIIFAIYQHLLLKKELEVTFANNFYAEDVDDFINTIYEDLYAHMNDYIYEIGTLLVKWTFDRLNFVDQAILLEACSEIKLQLNDRPVIIDEAVIFSKTYSDEDSFKYINGVLHRL